jgi:hypothetical protein
MFEIVCEVANISGKTLTIETSIPEAEKPDIQILKSGQQLGVFASPTRSTVKITVVSVEDADRIEKLEVALREIIDIHPFKDPEGDVSVKSLVDLVFHINLNARKALEGKDD